MMTFEDQILSAQSPLTEASELASLANERNKDIQVAVASNPNTPSVVLAKLAAKKDADLRIEVYYNCNTPDRLRDVLSDVIEGEPFENILQKACKEIMEEKDVFIGAEELDALSAVVPDSVEENNFTDER